MIDVVDDETAFDASLSNETTTDVDDGDVTAYTASLSNVTLIDVYFGDATTSDVSLENVTMNVYETYALSHSHSGCSDFSNLRQQYLCVAEIRRQHVTEVFDP